MVGRDQGIGLNFGPEALKTPDYKTPAQIEVVLDTRPKKWEIDWIVDGKSVAGKPIPVRNNPGIKFAGIGVFKGAEVKVSELKLTAQAESEK